MSDDHLQEELLNPFCEPIKAVEVSFVYKLWASIVAFSMILLPLCYLAIVIGAAWSVYYFAKGNTELLEEEPVIYIGLLIAGSLVSLFMIKPLFAPRPKPPAGIELDPEDQPLLFHFVEKLCDTVQAPTPDVIKIDAEPNASASFSGGMLSFLRGNMTLTIGLPFVKALTLQELTGVLAHEFGHFSQGAGMRLTYIVRSISAWFARVVYERDAWDETLSKVAAGAPHLTITLILWVTMFFIWLTRRILWCLMWLGHLISCGMLRQMEYDADRYEARVVGSDCFKSTTGKLTLYGAASQMAMNSLGEAWRENRLGDDMILLMATHAQKLSTDEDFLKFARVQNEEASTGLLDTHPAPKDRVASIETADESGIFHVDYPAEVLFNNYEDLCKTVTRAQYELMLEDNFNPSHLIPSSQLVKEQDRILDGYKAMLRFFQGGLLNEKELFLSEQSGRTFNDPQETFDAIHEYRSSLTAHADDIIRLRDAYAEATTSLVMAKCARVLLRAKLKIKAKDFNLPKAKTEEARAAITEHESTQQTIMDEAKPFRTIGVDRLIADLYLLTRDDIELNLEDVDKKRSTAMALKDILNRMENHWPAILQLREKYNGFDLLLNNYNGNEEHKPLIDLVLRTSKELVDKMKELRGHLIQIPYPFSHSSEDATVGSYALEKWNSKSDDVPQVYQDASVMIEQLNVFYYRLISELTLIAEEVESALGLEPLPDYDPPKEDGDDNG